ncbi:hypothetical protein [Nonlabens marinus]|nr:hypothetical protein [Nonlabens marinus]
MRYSGLKLWFAMRVAFFSAAISFPTLASGRPEITIITFASIGVPVGILVYHYFYKQERFVFLNVGIKKRELYLFATLFIWIVSIPMFLMNWWING